MDMIAVPFCADFATKKRDGKIKKKKEIKRSWYNFENPVISLKKANTYMAKGPEVCASNPTNGLGFSMHLRIAYMYSNSSGSNEFSLNDIILPTNKMMDMIPKMVHIRCLSCDNALLFIG
jgi:hypothetical protein